MILIFGKGRRTFDIGKLDHIESVIGTNGHRWLAFFKTGEDTGRGIDLENYDFAYVINKHGKVLWYKGAPESPTKRPDYLVTFRRDMMPKILRNKDDQRD